MERRYYGKIAVAPEGLGDYAAEDLLLEVDMAVSDDDAYQKS